jgi:hypothetical protein
MALTRERAAADGEPDVRYIGGYPPAIVIPSGDRSG